MSYLGLYVTWNRQLLFAFLAMTQQLPFCLARSIFLLFVHKGEKMPDRARSRGRKLIVLEIVVSTYSIYFTDDTATNNDRWNERWFPPDICVFCPSYLSLFARRLRSPLRHYSWQQGQGLGWRKVRSGWLLYFWCSFSDIFSVLPIRLQGSVGWKTKRPRLNDRGRSSGHLMRRTA